MAIQTTYPDTIARGISGAVADQQLWYNFTSRTVETAAGIGFALAVKRGTSDQAIVVTESGDTAGLLLGFTVRDQSVDPASPNSYAQYASAKVINKGVLWADAAVAVNAGDPVWVDVVTGLLYQATAANRVQYAGATWEDTISAAGLSRINLS